MPPIGHPAIEAAAEKQKYDFGVEGGAVVHGNIAPALWCRDDASCSCQIHAKFNGGAGPAVWGSGRRGGRLVATALNCHSFMTTTSIIISSIKRVFLVALCANSARLLPEDVC